MINCNYCSLGFINKAQLKNHVRNNHQSSVVLSFNGQSKSINRGSNNFFHCPKCNQDYKNPRSIYRHAACFFDSSALAYQDTVEIPESESSESEILGNDTTQPETLEIVESGQYTSARLEDSLSRIFLAYDSVNKLLVCTKCPILLNDNFVDHAMKIHGKVPHPELGEAIRTCLPISEFQVTLGFPIPAIPHLPIVQGFQCPSCQWCCAKKKSMTEHYKTHANNSYVQLSLQSISRGCCITFFPVVPPVSMPQIKETSFEVYQNRRSCFCCIPCPVPCP